MSKILTQTKTVTTRWTVPDLVEELEVKTVFDVCINEVYSNGNILPASCTVEETRTHQIETSEEPYVESVPDEEDLFKSVKALLNTAPASDHTLKQLQELQHWIEGKKYDINLAQTTFFKLNP